MGYLFRGALCFFVLRSVRFVWNGNGATNGIFRRPIRFFRIRVFWFVFHYTRDLLGFTIPYLCFFNTFRMYQRHIHHFHRQPWEVIFRIRGVKTMNIFRFIKGHFRGTSSYFVFCLFVFVVRVLYRVFRKDKRVTYGSFSHVVVGDRRNTVLHVTIFVGGFFASRYGSINGRSNLRNVLHIVFQGKVPRGSPTLCVFRSYGMHGGDIRVVSPLFRGTEGSRPNHSPIQ